MSRTSFTTFLAPLALALAATPALAQDEPDDTIDDETYDPDTQPQDDPAETPDEPGEVPGEAEPVAPPPDTNEHDPYAQPDYEPQPVDPEPVPAPAPPPAEPVPQPEPDRTDTRIYAPTVVVDDDEVDEKRDPVILTPMGMSVSLGGGLATFADNQFQDIADPGVAWDVRLAAGTRWPIALELAYLGSAQDIHALGLDEDALLVSHGGEAGLRLNFANFSRFTPLGLQPYIAGGVAFKRYSVENASFNTSNVLADDTVVEVPVGAGIGFRASQVMIDLRGAYRFSFNEDLLDNDIEDAEDSSAMDNWNLVLTGGIEF